MRLCKFGKSTKSLIENVEVENIKHVGLKRQFWKQLVSTFDSCFWCRNIQHDDIWHNDIQHNDIWHDDIWYDDILHDDILHDGI
jgi:hypothetical protein